MPQQRTPAALSFDDVPGSLPKDTAPKDVSLASKTAVTWLNNLQKNHLASNAIWRDILSFTDTFRTFHSVDIVCETLQKLSASRQRSPFSLRDQSKPRVVQSGESSWLDIDLLFTIQDGDLTGECSAVVSIVEDDQGEWTIWMLRTWLEHYLGHGNPDEPVLEGPTTNGTTNGIQEHVYDVIIVGGGQGGLGAAGRMKALGIDYVLFDDRRSIGDSWGDRYDSLKWHTIKEYSNLPFGRTFPDEETLVPKDRIAAGYKRWAEHYGINAYEGTHVDNSSWDEASKQWTVHTSGSSGNKAWKALNLVLAIGPGHKHPVSPEWASAEKIKASGFKGTILHSVNYQNPSAWAGKKGVVIGTANTAHDVAEDMADNGMATTMIQRSPTFIFPGEWLVHVHSKIYNLDTPTATSDREEITQPSKVLREMANNGIWGMIKTHPKRFDDLEQAGFKVDRYGDLFSHLYTRYGGHYVDIGSCARIVKGEIKVNTKAVKELGPDGLVFEDGSEIPADLIVLCTGYNHDFRKDAAEIVGSEIADQMDDFWSVDQEGELRGYSRLAGHPHLFYHGAECRLARFYSRFLALQLQKMKLGQPLTPYLEGKQTQLSD